MDKLQNLAPLPPVDIFIPSIDPPNMKGIINVVARRVFSDNDMKDTIKTIVSDKYDDERFKMLLSNTVDNSKNTMGALKSLQNDLMRAMTDSNQNVLGVINNMKKDDAERFKQLVLDGQLAMNTAIDGYTQFTINLQRHNAELSQAISDNNKELVQVIVEQVEALRITNKTDIEALAAANDRVRDSVDQMGIVLQKQNAGFLKQWKDSFILQQQIHDEIMRRFSELRDRLAQYQLDVQNRVAAYAKQMNQRVDGVDIKINRITQVLRRHHVII